MKAWVAVTSTSRGLRLNTNAAPPSTPLRGAQLLVCVSHAALNPVDTVLLDIVPAWLPFRQCPTPGLDFCGTVVAAGPCAEITPGTVVCGALGVATAARGTGSLAEYVVVSEALVAVKPEGLACAQAAGMMGIAGQTAALVMEMAQIKSGDKVLVNGASGGVGTLVVQLARHQDAVVIGVCSQSNIDLVMGLGAAAVVDYTRGPIADQVISILGDSTVIDLVIDCVGVQTLADTSPTFLKPGGKIINTAGGRSQGIVPWLLNVARPRFLGGVPRPYKLVALVPSGRLARKMTEGYLEGKVKGVPVDGIVDMADVPAAYEKLNTRRAKGKIVVRVQDPVTYSANIAHIPHLTP